jgi:hypothetical protein
MCLKKPAGMPPLDIHIYLCRYINITDNSLEAGMLKEAASFITYNLAKPEHGSRLADALAFYEYDTVKIFILLISNYICNIGDSQLLPP